MRNSRSQEAPTQEPETWSVSEDGELQAGDPRLSSEDRRLLGRVSRFLLHVLQARYLPRAIRAGYTQSEHLEFWANFDIAAGKNQTIPASMLEDNDPDRRAMLQTLDQFENLWFPRVQAIIARYVPDEKAVTFHSEFFRDLVQQPLGPGVLDSVAKLLDRIDALEKSAWPGALEVVTAIRSRGLTAQKATEIRSIITELRERSGMTPATPDDAARARGYQEQLAALRRLRRIWNDWATTLRPYYNSMEQLQLGLVVRKRSVQSSRPEEFDDAEPEEDFEDEGEEEDEQDAHDIGSDAIAF